jgi:hypothetical protein
VHLCCATGSVLCICAVRVCCASVLCVCAVRVCCASVLCRCAVCLCCVSVVWVLCCVCVSGVGYVVHMYSTDYGAVVRDVHLMRKDSVDGHRLSGWVQPKYRVDSAGMFRYDYVFVGSIQLFLFLSVVVLYTCKI